MTIRALSGIRLWFKETAGLFRLLSEIKRALKPILFYSEGAPYYKYFEGYIQHLIDHSDLEIFYLTSDGQDPCFEKVTVRFRVFYIRRWLAFLMPMIHARAFVMTMPELHRYHIRRSPHGTCHVYVFHAMVSTHMQYRKGSFDHYDAVFCAGPHHMEEIRETEMRENLKPKILVKAGYPLLEKMHEVYQRYRGKIKAEEPVVLIAPSWAPENIMDTCLSKAAKSLADHGYRVVIRPHPEFLKRKKKRYEGYKKEFQGESRIRFDDALDTEDALYDADLLITDWSGIAFEYALATERPVLYINTPRKVYNPDYDQYEHVPIELALRKELGAILDLDQLDKVPETVEDLLKNGDAYRQKAVLLRSRIVFHFGSASRRGAEFLMKLYAEKKTEPSETGRAEA